MNSDSKRRCPHCGGPEVFRSHRRGTMKRFLLRAVGVRPFRCVDCNARFYGLRDSYGPTSQGLRAA